MFCNKCSKELSECTCPDLERRLDGCENFAYKKCTKCGKHYARCECKEPDFVVAGKGSAGINLPHEQPSQAQTNRVKLVKHNSYCQQHYKGHADTRRHLTEGEIYDAQIEVHDCHTDYWIDGKGFNSVCFEVV